MKRGECTPAKSETPASANREASGHAFESRLAEKLGGTAKPGWRPRKGRRLSPFFGEAQRTLRTYALRPIGRAPFLTVRNISIAC